MTTGFDAVDRAPAMTARDFHQIRSLVYQTCGLDLSSGKERLVAARLGKNVREHNLRSVREYLHQVLSDISGDALQNMINALTTNHTCFFREPAHFDFLRNRLIPEWGHRNSISVWSAACSSGEEAYSIASILRENTRWFGLGRVHILATDVSTRVLRIAQQGVYRAERFKGLPYEWKQKHLLRSTSGELEFKLKPELRQSIEFRRQNLIETFAGLGPFSIIFCRNVLIYFDQRTQEDVVNRLTDCLETGGYLFIGHAESLTGVRHSLEYVQPAIYRKPHSGRASR